MNAHRPDAQEIESLISTLPTSLELDPLRAWWPSYLFHTTEFRNAVKILDSGLLLSRVGAGDNMAWDNANPEIIGQTTNNVKQMVRFYFRPRTPMTYNNEGFRTPPNRHPLAYCPMPVMLIFPSLPILTAAGVQFSDGNCASHETLFGTTAEFFKSLPFTDIYHDAPWSSEQEGNRIRHRRQAEVLALSPLDIRSHQFQVRVRSVAERETLLSELQPATVQQYRNRIQVASKVPLFHKRWSYIESVDVVDELLIVRFNESTTDRNDFPIRLLFSTPEGELIAVNDMSVPTTQSLRKTLSGSDLHQPFHLRIEFDGRIAYSAMLDPRPQMLISGTS